MIGEGRRDGRTKNRYEKGGNRGKNTLGGGIEREVMRKLDGEGIEKEERIWTEDRRSKNH